jgi:hypothetical protein
MRQQNLRRAGKIIHLLARGLEERDPDNFFSRHINVQCIVFCVTLLLFVIFCCVSGHSFSYDSTLIFARIIIIL